MDPDTGYRCPWRGSRASVNLRRRYLSFRGAALEVVVVVVVVVEDDGRATRRGRNTNCE
jgi:hypothetical protein